MTANAFIKMTSVAGSSSVAAHGYDKKTETMRISYHGTGNYDYYNITPFEYKSIEGAKSVGKQVKAVIDGKRFKRAV